MKTRSTSRAGTGEQDRSAASAQTAAQLRKAPAAMTDPHASSIAQLKHQEMASNSSQAAQLQARADMMASSSPLAQLRHQEMASNSSQAGQLQARAGMMAARSAEAPVQRIEDEEMLQGKFATAQRVEDEDLLQGKLLTVQRAEDEEEPLQGKLSALQRQEASTSLQGQANKTGLPDQLKSGIESLSGMSLDHVNVHYNSDKPSQLQAHAYAQGSEIHLAPGQEKHLPHEAWHVVQQAQGRVRPTVQMQGGVPVNDDVGLEREADLQGEAAALRGSTLATETNQRRSDSQSVSEAGKTGAPLLQRWAIGSLVMQKVKTEHEPGDLHYGISGPRYAGYEQMPEPAGIVVPMSANNPVSVDALNQLSGVTAAFTSVPGDRMAGYFAVIAHITANAPIAGKPGRWLTFLNNNLAYLDIAKHIAQIQAPGATAVAASKDRLNKNGRALDAAVGETEAGKRDAIVAAYARHANAPLHAAYNAHVSDWVWDVFFRRTSKLGIDFAVQEATVIHMNNFAPPRGGPAGLVSGDAGAPVRARQPITHSEMRHINRNYGVGHAHMDVYHMPATDPGANLPWVPNGPIARNGNDGEMLPYIGARKLRIDTDFTQTVLRKANLANWSVRAESIFRSRPTGVGMIRDELNSNHDIGTKLVNIRAAAAPRVVPARGRHADTRAFYQLIANLPPNLGVYGQPGTAQDVNNAITNSIKQLVPQVDAFALP